MSLDALLDRREPSALALFARDPLVFVARRAYALCHRAKTVPGAEPVRVVCVSDTHGQHAALGALPDGDVLIHAGDLTQSGTPDQVRAALEWLAAQPHAHKLFIAGNHDRALSDGDGRAALLGAFPALVYLEQTGATLSVRGRPLRVYGSPLTPAHGSWAFQYPRAAPEQACWDAIPPDTDIVVTHGPPAHHVDGGSGCAALLAALWRVRPRLLVCGHIHAARGIDVLPWSPAQAAYERICARAGGWLDLLRVFAGLFAWNSRSQTTTVVNAASLGGFRDELVRGPIVVDL